MTSSLVKYFIPKIRKALDAQMKQFTDAYSEYQYITPKVISALPIRLALINLHVYTATKTAKITKRELSRIQKKSADDDFWSNVIKIYLEMMGLDKLTHDITDTLKEQINKTLIKAHLEGWGVDETVRNLKDAPFLKYMTERIVRTELNKATNTGKMFAAADSSILVDKMWISTDDNRTRRIPRDKFDHLHMSGKQVPFTEQFIVPGMSSVEAMDYPGDPEASAANVCNCRCVVTFIPVRDANGKLVPNERLNQPTIYSKILEQAKMGNTLINAK